MLKRIKQGLFIFLIIFLFLIIFVMPSCLSFRMSDRKVQEYFANQPQKPVLVDLKVGKRKMRYAHIGNDSLPVAVFMHGSPGSWTDWKDFFKDSTLLRSVKMVAIDRPGFGQSGYGNTERSLQKQAELVKPILDKFQQKRPLILIGHSLGGPLIARLVMDYPQVADALVFVAPSIAPEHEKVFWIQHVGNWIPFRWLIPGAMKASIQEILPLKEELTKMLPLWQNIRQRTIYIHGTIDQLVPIGNADFAKKMLKNAPTDYVIVEQMNHFVPWSHPHLIKEAILKIVAEWSKK
ncbi:MAG: alpha/beta hydrolase [Microscillaceae bacterium]|nr:alpha/beta hydrolase [Microscillaceae bacterium]